MGQLLVSLDYTLFRFFNSFAGKSEVRDFIFSALADYVVFLMVAGFALFILLREKERIRWKISLQALAAAFLGRAIFIPIIRAFYFRQRPFVTATVHQLVAQSGLEGSFPSGHATIMFALAFTLLYINRRWGVVYLVLALASSTARIIAGVHFPFDIIGGILLGGLSTLGATWLFDFYVKRK